MPWGHARVLARSFPLIRRTAALWALGFCLSVSQAQGQTPSAERGKYIYTVAGCFACHTDTKNNVQELAGGAPLTTPFGTFYPPNITPDRKFGIGGWSDEDFLRALKFGVGPHGMQFYPAFPYVSYSQAKRRDLLDLRSYIFTLPASQRRSRPHDLGFPYSFRSLVRVWKYLNFEPKPWTPDDRRGDVWNRGSYLVNALAHCGECHTPRNFLGALDRSRWMAGAPIGNGDAWAPNLTPDKSGLADWSLSDIVLALEVGITPTYDVLGGPMAEVVRYSTGKMTKADLTAIATYLQALPPLQSSKRRR